MKSSFVNVEFGDYNSVFRVMGSLKRDYPFSLAGVKRGCLVRYNSRHCYQPKKEKNTSLSSAGKGICRMLANGCEMDFC